ncbi:hypothetical protein GOBAR_AA36621 [Gossypium barbadense]|uniref:Uncharacterized protein n=1 Tax=Gossypium barbadense TaxID=3634 RepID=A0A2P5VZ17_GOSBA|nr:hypothetical protein GOBAR_AA36621 [Gossypium barbadense]
MDNEDKTDHANGERRRVEASNDDFVNDEEEFKLKEAPNNIKDSSSIDKVRNIKDELEKKSWKKSIFYGIKNQERIGS